MDWQAVKTAICDGRKFTLTDEGCRVLADTMLPSGHCITVHIQPQFDTLFIHDGGAAFDELARHAFEVNSMAGVRRMLSEDHFGMTDRGEVFCERILVENAAVGVALVADASLRAYAFMAAHAKRPATQPLDRKVKDALRTRYPNGQPDYRFEGKNRQHRFDFGVKVGAETFLVQAVTPDMSSVSSAVLKAIDAREAPNARVRPILVFDQRDGWSSSALNMLAFGGVSMDVTRLEREQLPLAA